MHIDIEQALSTVLKNWRGMSGAGRDEAESTADEFEASFYSFIDTLRTWIYELEHKPQTLDEALELPLIKSIVLSLPEPLYLNLETELELILENNSRIDEDKYD
ncbi:hypothetical protein D3C73_718400 [compost metagenome]